MTVLPYADTASCSIEPMSTTVHSSVGVLIPNANTPYIAKTPQLASSIKLFPLSTVLVATISALGQSNSEGSRDGSEADIIPHL